MVKRRKSPTVLKPVIDEETALRFPSAGTGRASEPSSNELLRSTSKHSAASRVSNDDAFEKDAARKNRTVEEHLKKHLTKHFEK